MGAFTSKTMRMMEQVLDRENLQRAWRKVRANSGAPGVDGMSVEDFPAFARAHWERIRSALREGSYCPAPVRRVWIPKPDGSQRPLGVPTVLDRVIQQALAQVLGPLFEGGFSDRSYGFREGRSAHPLDKELERRGHCFARYADDFLVLVKSAKAAGRVLASLTRFVEGRLDLVVNRTKSRSGPLKTCAFLGFQIGPRGQAVWTAKALSRFKERVREITRRSRGRRAQDVVDELRRYVSGWVNYFGISQTYTVAAELAEWIRRRVRLYHWKQWKQPRTRRRHLLAMGIPPEQVHLASRSRKGYWRMSGNSILQRALANHRLHQLGVPDLRTLWIVRHYGPQARV